MIQTIMDNGRMTRRHYDMRSGDLDRDVRIRNPIIHKGLRTRFRTQLKAKGFKYRTDLNRRGTLVVTLRKGDVDKFSNAIREEFPWMTFEGFQILIRKGKGSEARG